MATKATEIGEKVTELTAQSLFDRLDYVVYTNSICSETGEARVTEPYMPRHNVMYAFSYVSPDNGPVNLTPTEFDTLFQLLVSDGKGLPMQDIEDAPPGTVGFYKRQSIEHKLLPLDLVRIEGEKVTAHTSENHGQYLAMVVPFC